MKITLYKVLDVDGSALHGGLGKWHLPRGKMPGKWMPLITDIAPCRRGYHLSRGAGQLLLWLGPVIWEAEARGACVQDRGGIVVGQARLVRRCEHWTERTARLLAADFAERVLPIYERVHTGDDRLRTAIETARRYARGDATRDDLCAAGAAARASAKHCAPAWAPARAAWAAAGDAAWAAWAATCATAGATAGAAIMAARATVSATERRWQARRLRKLLRGEIYRQKGREK